jgi:hypothetical protein
MIDFNLDELRETFVYILELNEAKLDADFSNLLHLTPNR